MFVVLRYVLHPGSKKFSGCTPYNNLTTLFFIFGGEHDFLLADAGYATLRYGWSSGISPGITQEVVLGAAPAGGRPRKQYLAMMSGLGIHYDLGEGHLLLGRRMPDLDLITSEGPLRVFTLLHEHLPVVGPR